jgi:hypothetical protein
VRARGFSSSLSQAVASNIVWQPINLKEQKIMAMSERYISEIGDRAVIIQKSEMQVGSRLK